MKATVIHGLGFPVEVIGVRKRTIRGEEVLDIPWNALAGRAFAALPSRPHRLTGSQVRFVRQHLGKTLEEFGKLFGKTHVAVLKWESSGDSATKMDWPTEKDIRLHAQAEACTRATDFRKLYKSLQSIPCEEPALLRIDCRDGLAAAV